MRIILLIKIIQKPTIFLENGTTSIDEVKEYSCNDELYN